MPENYLHFSRRERMGIAALLALIVLMYLVPVARERWWRPDELPPDSTRYYQTFAVLNEMMVADTVERINWNGFKKDSFYGRRDSRRSWTAFKKDSFRRPWPAFQKDSFRRSLSAYKSPYPRYERLTSLDINVADTTLWDRLPGIGPVLARRIVLFRERLGGFHSVVQVGETFGLEDSVFVKIQPLLQLGNVSLRKIDINQTDEKSLADHPYIDTKLARAIIRYRSSHGPFRVVEELKGLALVDDVIYRKIEKYLVVN